ncbi:M48 family metalloprotease [Burkholderia pseudomallei]|uniref:M48 family metalloprotease n=1 Tax=Burkholderia pseudomallei TaxID=28450 RepID=UPI0021F6B51A|nr:M48 family metalloprotease [Burkholderia pseudomallei]MCW0022772.1 M48 family metalloprotease [Burkholderia pseudomallei]MCW0168395.1 M48 family metalloprotease [Burkholderia pseudomallei]
MSGHWNNIYSPHFVSDNALCVPVLPQEQLFAILLRTQQIAESIVGEGMKPKVSFDMEHLQVADYTAFPPITQQQKDAIRRLQSAQPVRGDELAYLALRSLFGLFWDQPQSEDDIRRAAAYDKALEMVLTEVCPSVAETLAQQDGPLPYWGRLAFLRVMATIPDEQIEAQRLQRFACVMLKDPVFNARSFQYGDHGLVGLNFALEPILKSLNRMLLHFFHTQDSAGPRRMERAWNSLVPIVAYFWARGAVAANRLSPMHVLFDESMMANAHAMTASQVDFIIRHELGHLIFDHANRLRAITGDTEAATALRHEFEFSADTFAQGSLRSALYSHLRVDLQWVQETASPADTDSKGLAALHEHQREVSAVRLLFTYMDAVDQIGRLLKRRLGDAIRFRRQMDSHPPARERLARLDAFHVGEHTPTSQLLRYAEGFFLDVLGYAETLDDAALASPLRDLY